VLDVQFLQNSALIATVAVAFDGIADASRNPGAAA
jgi:hypothetical protein